MPTVKHGEYTYHIREDGVFIGSGAASSTNLLDPEFQVGLEIARQHYRLHLAKLNRAEMPGYVYIGFGNPVWPPDNSVVRYKIGSTNNPDGRMSFGIEEIGHIIRCDSRRDAFQLEAYFHRRFRRKKMRTQKEWFDLEESELRYVLAFDYVSGDKLTLLKSSERPWD